MRPDLEEPGKLVGHYNRHFRAEGYESLRCVVEQTVEESYGLKVDSKEPGHLGGYEERAGSSQGSLSSVMVVRLRSGAAKTGRARDAAHARMHSLNCPTTRCRLWHSLGWCRGSTSTGRHKTARTRCSTRLRRRIPRPVDDGSPPDVVGFERLPPNATPPNFMVGAVKLMRAPTMAVSVLNTAVLLTAVLSGRVVGPNADEAPRREPRRLKASGCSADLAQRRAGNPRRAWMSPGSAATTVLCGGHAGKTARASRRRRSTKRGDNP